MSTDLYRLIKSGRIKVVQPTSPPEHRFWQAVDKQGPKHPTLGRCWVWLRAKSHNGYGYFTIKRKSIRAHRFSYELHTKPIPEGLDVLHKCDNPACVNPKHLFTGTTLDNHRDKVAKGRQARGETNGFSRFTELQIKEIRRRYKLRSKSYHDPINGQGALAKEFETSQAQISLIVRGQIWKHI